MRLAALRSRLHGGKRGALKTPWVFTHDVDDVAIRTPLVLEATQGTILGLGEGGVLHAPGLLAHEVHDPLVCLRVIVLQAVLRVADMIDEARSLDTAFNGAGFSGGENVAFFPVEGAPLGLGVLVWAVSRGGGTTRVHARSYRYI